MLHGTADNSGHGQSYVKTYMQLQLQCNKLCAHLMIQVFNTGTDWADKAKLEAQAALKTRYGMEDDAQARQGLEIVAKQMYSMYALPDYVPDPASQYWPTVIPGWF
jgi:hypothetical protein